MGCVSAYVANPDNLLELKKRSVVPQTPLSAAKVTSLNIILSANRYSQPEKAAPMCELSEIRLPRY